MAKKVKTVLKLVIIGGQASPGGKVGPALGQHGLNIAEFCQKFNEATKNRQGELTPVEITVFEDRTYTFITKVAPASELIKKAINIQKGSGETLKKKVGKITKAQLREVAEKKMPDLNAHDIDAAMKTIAGTARQMGVEVVD